MAAPFPYVNKLVTPAMYAIQRTKFLSDVAAMRVDRAGLMPFDKLADSPVYNSTADFVTLDELLRKDVLGKVIAYTWIIEFQKKRTSACASSAHRPP